MESEPLMPFHSITIQDKVVSMEITETSKLLVTSAFHPISQLPSLNLYSLDPSNDFFDLKGKITPKSLINNVIFLLFFYYFFLLSFYYFYYFF